MKSLLVYVAGKVSKNSSFGKYNWRDEFVEELERLTGLRLTNLDPTKTDIDQANPDLVFGSDVFMISRADVLIVYLSNDISVGGSQEILIAKYFKKPVIGLAPYGGKFHGSTKEYFDKVVENYRDPFVFATCDVVCGNVQEVAKALSGLKAIRPKGTELIKQSAAKFEHKHLATNSYLKDVLGE